MSAVTSATMRLLQSKGLSLDDIIEVAEQIESEAPRRVDTAADKRRAWDRQRKADRRAEERAEGGMSGGQSTGIPPETPPLIGIEERTLSPDLKKESKGRGRVRASDHPVPDDWAVTAARRDRLRARGASDRLIDDTAEAMISWARGKGVKRADWDAVHDGFVSRDLKATGPPGAHFATNGHSGGFNGRAHKAGNGHTAGGSRGDVFLAAMAEQFAGGGAVDERDADDPGEQGSLRGPTIDGKIVGRGDR